MFLQLIEITFECVTLSWKQIFVVIEGDRVMGEGVPGNDFIAVTHSL